MAITVDLLNSYYSILNILSIFLSIFGKLYSIYFFFYEQEHIILDNAFPQSKWSPTFAIKSVLQTALRIAPNWTAGHSSGNET